MTTVKNPTLLICAHCGADSGTDPIIDQGVAFCCEGCKTVYGILNSSGFCDYYAQGNHPGVKQENPGFQHSLEELNLMESNFTIYSEQNTHVVLFHIPSMHCSSCIWLLEKIGGLDQGILESRVDFLKKQARIRYDASLTQFGKIVLLLKNIGYEPSLMPEDDRSLEKKQERKLLIKLGVAGFCAGNIMMFSFPEYFGLNTDRDAALGKVFHTLNIALSLPLIFFCASEYFLALKNWLAFKGISVKVPLAMGIGMLWLRSVYEIVSATGPGYFDSLAGLVFFLLIGTWLQNRTFDALRFGEKAQKFFPLVARTLVGGKESPKKVTELVAGDRVLISHGEIVPADGILMGSDAHVDFSFVTGESVAIHKVAGEVIFGGGRNAGVNFEMEVIRPFDHSKLSDLWNHTRSKKENESVLKFEAAISKYFIAGTLFLSILALVIWLPYNQQKAWFAFTAVLMVACPCALALAPPFAYNIVTGFFARLGLFLKAPPIAGIIGETKVLVFDKTGTLTTKSNHKVIIPKSYSLEMENYLASLTSHSLHPYSGAVNAAVVGEFLIEIEDFIEKPGYGIQGRVGNNELKLGSAVWVGVKTPMNENQKQLYFSINGMIAEPIRIVNNYQEGLKETLQGLRNQGMKLILSTGDSLSEKTQIEKHFPGIFHATFFEQSPSDKVKVIRDASQYGRVIMVGDGLNDAAALQEGDAGLVVAENTRGFTPEASGILLHENIKKLPLIFNISRQANRIVKETFLVSLLYNVVALWFAISGQMNPLLAAIIMPASSIFLMVYAWGRTTLLINKTENK